MPNLKVLNVTLPVLPGTPPRLIQEGNKGKDFLWILFISALQEKTERIPLESQVTNLWNILSFAN